MQAGTYRYTRVTHLACRHCHALIAWPRWIRTEHLHYDSLCWPCFDTIDRDFTPARCIAQARALVRGSAVWL